MSLATRSVIRSTALWPSWFYSGASLLHTGTYIFRKDLGSVTVPAASHLAAELACFDVAYAIARFVGGELADRSSARRAALLGSLLSIACTAALAFASPHMVLLLIFSNGFGQDSVGLHSCNHSLQNYLNPWHPFAKPQCFSLASLCPQALRHPALTRAAAAPPGAISARDSRELAPGTLAQTQALIRV